MDRHRLLGVLGSAGATALAGCISALGPTARNVEDHSDDGRRRVSLVDVATVPDGLDIRTDVEMLASRVTSERTARLRLTPTNEGDRRLLSVGTGGCNPFDRRRGGSDDPPGLWLLRPELSESVDRADSRWVRDQPADEPRRYPGYGCSLVPYETGESRTVDYHLWDDYRVDGYMEPGTYRWAEEAGAWVDPDATAGDDPDATFTVGFTLRVDRVGELTDG